MEMNVSGSGQSAILKTIVCKAVDDNVIIDAQACTRDASKVANAAAVAEAIEAKLPR